MSSIEEILVRRALDSSALSRGMDAVDVVLPKVDLRVLEGAEIEVPPPTTPRDEEVELRVIGLRRLHGTHRVRKRGDPVALGDAVEVDVVGYSAGKIASGTARTGMWLQLGVDQYAEGFDQALKGAPVGQMVHVQGRIASAHPLTALRGQPAIYTAKVTAAEEVKAADENDSRFLAKAGRVKDGDQLRAQIFGDLAKDAEAAFYMGVFGQALQELVKRSNVKVTPALVEQAITRQWLRAEGQVLLGWNLPPADREDALKGWLAEPAVRQDTQERLARSLVLQAIAEKEAPNLEQAEVQQLVKALATTTGTPLKKLKETLKSPEGAALAEAFGALLLSRHVLSRVKVKVTKG